MVVLQDRIIYMPSMPPFARRERVEDYCPSGGKVGDGGRGRGVRWVVEGVRSGDGVEVRVVVGGVGGGEGQDGRGGRRRNVVVVYFQGCVFYFILFYFISTCVYVWVCWVGGIGWTAYLLLTFAGDI